MAHCNITRKKCVHIYWINGHFRRGDLHVLVGIDYKFRLYHTRIRLSTNAAAADCMCIRTIYLYTYRQRDINLCGVHTYTSADLPPIIRLREYSEERAYNANRVGPACCVYRTGFVHLCARDHALSTII